MNENIKERAIFALGGYDSWRVNAFTDCNGNVVVRLDLHYLTCSSCKKIIKNVIAITRSDFTFLIIHGQNHGTAIRDMVRNEVLSERIVSRIVPDFGGATILKVA